MTYELQLIGGEVSQTVNLADGYWTIGHAKGRGLHTLNPHITGNDIELSDYFPAEYLVQLSGIGAQHGSFRVDNGKLLYSSGYGTIVIRAGSVMVSVWGWSIGEFLNRNGVLYEKNENGLEVSGDFVRLMQGDILVLGQRVTRQWDPGKKRPVPCIVRSGSNPLEVRVL